MKSSTGEEKLPLLGSQAGSIGRNQVVPIERFPEGSEAPDHGMIERRPSMMLKGPQRRSFVQKEGLTRKQKKPKKPWRSMSLRERTYYVMIRVISIINVLALLYLGYLAFGLFRADKQQDPMAWRLAFGIAMVSRRLPLLFSVILSSALCIVCC